MNLLLVRYVERRSERMRWYVFPMQPVRAIILKLEGSAESPFLYKSFTTDSPQEGGCAPEVSTLLNKVASAWCVQSSLRSVLYVIPSGPGADFLLDLLRTLRISRGLMGALLNCVKSALSGEVGR